MGKHILVTNDDGVSSPGLLALARELRRQGTVSILAPDRNWSARGHVKTLDRALRVREFRLPDDTSAFGSDGAPSDCVALGAGFVSVSPLHLDLTAHRSLSYLNTWEWAGSPSIRLQSEPAEWQVETSWRRAHQ